MKKSRLVLNVLSASVLTACGTLNNKVSSSIDKEANGARTRFSDVSAAPLQVATPSRVVETKGRFMPAVPATSARHGEWLRKYKIAETFRVDSPVSMTAIMQWMTKQGINVVSDMPLDNVMFSGQINPTDAETALKMISNTVNLDFVIDDARHVVTIRPMGSKTWTINIGNRKSSYTTDNGNNSNNNNNGNGSTGSNTIGGIGNSSMGGNSGAGSGQGGFGMSQNNNSSGTNSSNNTNPTIVAVDDFWTSLDAELKKRLKVMVPKEMLGKGAVVAAAAPAMPTQGMPMQVPAIPGRMPGGAATVSAGDELMVEKTVGNYAINPETGSITVHAPSWLLRDLDAYFKNVQEMYNTDITFTGEIVLVTSSDQESEALDISAIATWASQKYGLLVSNNALGGITIGKNASGVPSITAGSQTVGGALVGATFGSPNNAMQAFNAYLAQRGNVSIAEKPLITTTSGVAGVFKKKMLDYYNTTSQGGSTGNVGAASTYTQNTLVQYQTGTELRVNPRIDISTGMIRAPLMLDMTIKTGDRDIPQLVSAGNTVQTFVQKVPLLAQHQITGEVLLRDGDLVIVGGQIDNKDSISNNGLPSASSGPIGGIFGVKNAGRDVQTYFFVLRVIVNKRAAGG